jgi:protein-serine/threonine kinase
MFDRTSGPMVTTSDLRFISPEEIKGIGKQISTPFWVLGIMLYELYYGRHPFANKNPKVMRQLILKYPVSFPEPRAGAFALSPETEMLICDLLAKDWGQRLGSERFETEIMKHSYFSEEF